MATESEAVGEPNQGSAQRSAVMATKATKMIQMTANTASLFLRRRLKASPQRVRDFSSGFFTPLVSAFAAMPPR